MNREKLNYFEQLEAESIYILRETMAEFKNPVLLYSIGKDSSVLLHLARKAFWPAKIPFPLLHIDTGFKPKEMIEFRDYFTTKIGSKLIVYKNNSDIAQKLNAEDAHNDLYIYHKKTKPLLDALKINNFDAAIGGARREEEKSRAKERIFSVRDEMGGWDPKNQRPELWNLYNTRLSNNQTMRVFPLSNWTELDIWSYIQRENIEVVSLYFAKKRKVLKRNGIYIKVDEYNIPKTDEEIIEMWCRYRTLGCSPSTGLVCSQANNLEQILDELNNSIYSERQNRAIDNSSASAMEQKKKEGYF